MSTSDLASLFQSFLKRQVASPREVAGPGEAVPHQAGLSQQLNANECWEAAVVPLELLTGVPVELVPPPGWGTLVEELNPAVALPCAAANFPQLVRPVASLFRVVAAPALESDGQSPLAPSSLAGWAESAARSPHHAESIMALGVLRVAGEFAKLNSLLPIVRSNLPDQWRAALANEEAALAWQQGRRQEAHDLWMAEVPSTPVLFNRGMAALFLGRPTEAAATLRAATAQLPKDDSWHHLAMLYLALAEAAA
jgi:hypothetical protein